MSGQLSAAFSTPSPSVSLGSNILQLVVFASSGHGSHASPMPSLSKSGWAPMSIGRTGLNTVGQLSIAFGMPSPSLSSAVIIPVYTVDPITEAGRIGVQLGSFIGGPLQKNAG